MVTQVMTLKSVITVIFLTFLLNSTSFAQTQTLRGAVFNAESGEPLTGATVILDENSYYGVAGLDGTFIIRNIPLGTYEVAVSYISFETHRQTITIGTEPLRLEFRLSPSVSELGELTVIATRDLRNEESARATERNADLILNIVDARSIDISPDATVANVVQRVSGVSIERSSSGDGQHAIVRGMDKRYNYTLVNGIKIPSPEVKNRYVPLDIFPSSLLDRLVVSKTLTPDMEGDAVGGVIDMRMRNAPDRFTVNADIGIGYSQLYFNRDRLSFNSGVVSTESPHEANGTDYRATIDDFPLGNIDFRNTQAPVNRNFTLAVGNRFLDNRIGFLLAGSYQQSYRGANSLFFEMDVDREDNNPFYDTVEDRQISTEQSRGGIHLKTDLRIDNNNIIEWYNAGIVLEEKMARAVVDTNLRIGRSQGPGTGRISESFRSRQQTQQIYNSTLQGTHNLLNNDMRVNWSGVYSLATNDDPDMVDLKLITGARINSDGELIQEPVLLDRDLRRRWTNNSDQDLAGYLDISYVTDLFNLNWEFKIGSMYRHKTRENTFNSYLLRASPITQQWTGDINNHSWQLFNPGGTPTDPLNYESEEDIFAYYAMTKVNFRDLQVIGGVRIENTDFSWESSAPPQISGRVGNRNYRDILPSIHVKYSFLQNTNLRASYFESISRPNFFEVIPYSINEDDFRERGNPFLERTQARNFDLRFEYFPSAVDQIMIAGFIKEIKNPIEAALILDGQAFILQPNNFGTANNLGVEVDVTKYIRNFGLRAFYTFTDSRITTVKTFRFRDANGNLTSESRDQTRPLQGQSKHISNLSLLYKNGLSGTDAQLSAVYTGRRIISVSPYFDNDIWQRSFWQLDFSIEQRILPGIRAYAKINNILNTPMRADVLRPNTANPQEASYIDVSETTLVREDFFQQTYLFGIKYTL
ncbi:MAG: TonB-dependent receptor [Balneolaceae bacterium]|nr:MAG: TonB-dependent receptor [Balneolaceae bacterium]